MIREEISDLLHRSPFLPFTIHLTSGERFEVRDSALAALLKSGLFIAFPNSDRRIVVPFLHIAAAVATNGRETKRRKR